MTSGTGRLLVLITGTGRSGTSTMSGTFHHLGLAVPGPLLGANESNPKGFFESRWSVRFHDRLAERAGIATTDNRPHAFEQAQAVVTPKVRARLLAFLVDRSADHRQIVVKDPRTIWFQKLWGEVAAEAGLEVRYVSMLRHPAEVVGSRTTYYSGHAGAESDAAAAKRHRYVILNIARWINGSLISERETRGQARAFVRYTDLLSDWRPVVERLRTELGLHYDSDPQAPGRHPVDDFIDPDLRRHAVTWGELDAPAALTEIAQGVWDELQILADHGGVDLGAQSRLDALAVRYDRLLVDAEAITEDGLRAAVLAARAAGAAEARSLSDVSGRELLKALRTRISQRLGKKP